VKTEIHRLNTMITNFLNYGKPLKLEPRPCDLAPLLHDVVSMASGKAEEQGIEIERDSSVDLPRVLVDGEQIKTCFVNVLVNAFQAMPSGGRLSITTALVNGTDPATSTPPAGSERWVEVRFQDTGCGIASEDLAKVFEPYFTTKEVGIGLGLALTKKIVEEHGGVIALASVRDQGTTVRIRLPVEEQG
jgi:signal transduction histidine kinase